MPSVLALHRCIARGRFGVWLFSRLVCFKAPYFATINPRIDVLEPHRCEAVIEDRRRIRNHIGTVHAIALCNLAELVGGLMTDASIPKSTRWIPKGMQVTYVKKAVGRLRGMATPEFAPPDSGVGYELPVNVQVRDRADEVVFRARITMWVSPRH